MVLKKGAGQWESTTQPDNIGKARFGLQKKVEYILFYARKTSDMKPFILQALDGEGKSYPHRGKFGKCRFEIIERAYDGAYARPTMRFKILGREPRQGKQWQIGEETAKQLEAEGKLEIVDGIVKRAVYPDDDTVSYVPFWSHLASGEAGTSQKGKAELYNLMGSNIGFDTVKPVQLIIKLLKHFADDALVLDFFAGSATTAHAVMKLNSEDGGTRRFVVVQLPEPTLEDSEARKAGFATVADISRKRIELAGERVIADAGLQGERLDVGFRTFRLSDTNFSKWQVSSATNRSILEQHLFSLRGSSNDNSTADDLLVETLLKQGYSLSEKIVISEVAGLEVRVVGDNLVLAYLTEATKPTLDQLRGLVDQDPQRIIILEDAFQGDDELKTNLAQLCKSKGIELWTA